MNSDASASTQSVSVPPGFAQRNCPDEAVAGQKDAGTHVGDPHRQPTRTGRPPMPDVDTAQYPQLRLICWNSQQPPVLDPEIAFGKYELYWPFVDQTCLTDRERALIQELAEAFGMDLINA